MGKLNQDFPGFAQLDAAGEATTAKVRKRIENGTLREIDGIGEQREQEIRAAFVKLDNEDARRADNEEGNEHAQQAKGDKTDESASGTLINQGGISDEALDAGEAEAKKPGAQKNIELPNHDLGELTPKERRDAGIADSQADRLVHSGAVYVYDPAGAYASRTAVHIPESRGQIKVDPLHHVSPHKGMRVKHGDDEYVISDDSFGLDTKPQDWLRVRSPNTNQPFI